VGGSQSYTFFIETELSAVRSADGGANLWRYLMALLLQITQYCVNTKISKYAIYFHAQENIKAKQSVLK